MITQTVFTNDLEGRIDPLFYYSQSKISAKISDSSEIKQIAHIQGGFAFKSKEYTKVGIPLVRIQNIKDGRIDLTDTVFIKEEYKNSLSQFLLEERDILIAMTGATIGKIGMVYKNNLPAFLNQRVGRFVFTDNDVNRDYIYFICQLPMFQNQVKRLSLGGAQPNISPQSITNIKIPFPPLETQNQVASIMQSAYKDREEKLKQADELLNSIDGYVRQQLGIDYTEPEEEKIYTVNSQDLEGNRQDPYYYNPKFANLLNTVSCNLKMVSLSDISEDIFNGNTPAKENYTNEGKPIVKVSCLKKNKIEWSNLAYAKDKKLNKHLRDNDILLLSSAHQAEYLGKNPCLVEIPDDLRETDITFVGELICIRPNTKLVNPYYLLATLRLDEYHQLINREKRGQTSHIYPDDLEKIKIPLADKGKQDVIAQEFKNRLSKTADLKKEASKLLEDAKKKVEEMILN